MSSGPHYDLEIVLSPRVHGLEVSGTVTLPPQATPRDNLGFLLREDLGPPRIEVVAPESCVGTVELVPKGLVPGMGATQDWEGSLPGPCPPNSPLVLSVSYGGDTEANGRWLYLGVEGPYSSNYVSAWLPMFGYRRGTGTLRYTVPNPMVVKAAGRLVAREEHGDQAVYVFTADLPTVFDFAAGHYTVAENRVGDVPVTFYLLEPLADAEEILARTVRILAVLEEEFGPYPFGEIAIVEAPTEPGTQAGFEAMANQGFLLARSDYLRANSDEIWWIAHELTHFWFPYVVGRSEGTGGAFMMDEALAHYGALCAVEAISGSEAAERFRRKGGKEATHLTAAGHDTRLGEESASEDWDRVAYQFADAKGHLIYDMLARTIGRDRFRSALHRITREHAATDLAWPDFLGSIERDAGQPLAWFYDQWLNRGGVPILSLDWSQDGRVLKCVVTQTAPFFRLDLPLQVEIEDGTTLIHRAPIEAATYEVEIPINQPVHTVRLDPHYTTLHSNPEEWAEALALSDVTNAKLRWDADGPNPALPVFQEGLKHLPEPDPYGVEFLLRLHIGWIHQENGQFDEANAEYHLALALAVRPAEHLARLYLNLATMASRQGDRARLAWAVANVLSAERALGNTTDKTRQAQELLAR
jgi:hypothetical protein